MHAFVTGGTGTIGSAVVAELLSHGHTVLALARSDSSSQTLEAAGAEVLRGNLADLDVLRAGAAQSDGVINLAFGSDYSTAEAVAQSVAEEAAALTALGEELIGSGRPIVAVSGTPWIAGRASTEADPVATDNLRSGPISQCTPGPGLAWRTQHRRPSAAYGPQPGPGRVRRPLDQHGSQRRGVRLPR